MFIASQPGVIVANPPPSGPSSASTPQLTSGHTTYQTVVGSTPVPASAAPAPASDPSTLPVPSADVANAIDESQPYVLTTRVAVIKIEVEDNGVGISETEQAKLFQVRNCIITQ